MLLELLLLIHLDGATQFLQVSVKAAPLKRNRNRLCHQARRRAAAKVNSQVCKVIKRPITRRSFPRQYDKDATKTGKKAK